MALSKSRIQNRLRPILLAKLPKEIIDEFVDEDWLEYFNNVAEDLNREAYLRLERYCKTTGADNSEDDDYTNYLVQRKIEKVLSISLHDPDWEDIKWTFLEDRIALSQTSNGYKLDILYLGKPESVDALTDEIDLPDEVLEEYMEILEAKILSKFSDNGNIDYQQILDFYGKRARQKAGKNIYYNKGIKRTWFHQKGDDFVYDIKKNYVSLENFTTDINSNLVYSGYND